MIYYRVQFNSDTDGNAGSSWFVRRREALKAGKTYQDQDDGNGFEIKRIEIKLTSVGVLEALNGYAGHPDNG